MQGYKLDEGKYVENKLTQDEMWENFNWLFSTYSRNDTSYKFIFFKSIIDCIDKKDANGRISFDLLFTEFTRLSWNLVLKYSLLQKSKVSDGRISILEKVLKTNHNGEENFKTLLEADRKKICHEVKIQCKKYVVGALYGDTNGYLYSFSKKEEWIELNPLMEDFIKKNKALLENLNYYKWAKFYENVNGTSKAERLVEEYDLRGARKNESAYRTILAYEFESIEGKHTPRANTLELLMLAEHVDLDDSIDMTDVDDEFYKDFSHMNQYMKDPVLLIKQLKQEKGLI